MSKLQKRRLYATGLLVLVALLFFLSHSLRQVHPLLAWVEAFCEAALVGALADWFAVTALFRRPLGLPIPHTAILPAQKEKLAPALAKFVRTDLFSKKNLTRHIREKKVAQTLLRQLAKPSTLFFVVQKLNPAEPAISPTQYDFRTELFESVKQGLQQKSWKSALVSALRSFLAHPQRREWTSLLFAAMSGQVSQQGEWIRTQAQAEAPLKDLPLIGKLTRSLSENYSKKTLRKVILTIDEAVHDLEHPLYDVVEQQLARFVQEAQTNPAFLKELQGLKTEILKAAPFSRGMDSAPNSNSNSDSDSKSLFSLTQDDPLLLSVAACFEKAAAHPQAVQSVERLLLSQLHRIMRQHGRTLEEVMSTALLSWDAQTFSRKIEERVGADLQYIRISGTIVGGIIGLALHALKLIF